MKLKQISCFLIAIMAVSIVQAAYKPRRPAYPALPHTPGIKSREFAARAAGLPKAALPAIGRPANEYYNAASPAMIQEAKKSFEAFLAKFLTPARRKEQLK